MKKLIYTSYIEMLRQGWNIQIEKTLHDTTIYTGKDPHGNKVEVTWVLDTGAANSPGMYVKYLECHTIEGSLPSIYAKDARDLGYSSLEGYLDEECK